MIRKIKKEVGCSFKENIQYMDQTLPVEKSFDIIRREMEIGGKESVFYYIDGFIKDEAMLKIMDSFSAGRKSVGNASTSAASCQMV